MKSSSSSSSWHWPAPVLLAVALFSWGPLRSMAAVDAFVRFRAPNGSSLQYAGESTDRQFPGSQGWNEVLWYDEGILMPISDSRSSSGATTTGRASFKDFTFSKRVDKGSPVLFQACASGRTFAEVDLVLRDTGTDERSRPKPFYSARMTAALVKHLSWAGSDQSSVLDENVAVTYGAIEWTYSEFDAKGALQATTVNWDTVRNRGGNGSLPGLPRPPAVNQPSITSLLPNAITANGNDFTLTVNGALFENGATLRWNGAARTTTFVSSTQLTALIPASDLISQEPVRNAVIKVANPGGPLSPAVLLPILAAPFIETAGTVIEGGLEDEVDIAPQAPGRSGLKAFLSNLGGDNPVSLSAVNFESQPVTDRTVFGAGTTFVDLKLDAATPASSLSVSFYYPNSIAGPAEASLALLYYNGSQWLDVRTTAGALPPKDTTDDLDQTVSGGRFAVVFDDTSTPRATELSGTVFAMALDTTAPVINSVSSTTANGSYTSGASIFITVDFSEAVVVTGTPQLQLNSGASALASYSSGSGSSTLTFTYTIGAQESSADLDYSSSSALTLHGGAIADAAGNEALLNLPAPGAAGSLGANSVVVIDTIPPTISISSPFTSFTGSAPVSYTVTYADANLASSTLSPGDINVLSTGTASALVSVSGSGATRLVTLSSITGDGTLGISLAAGTATDTAGNPAPVAGPSATFTVDNTAPSLVISPPSSSITAGGSVTYTVTYGDAFFNSSTLSANDITLNKTGTADASVAISGTDNTRTVTLSSITGDGTLSISLAAGTATDTAGNPAPVAGPSATFSVDNTAPSIVISPPSSSITAGRSVTYTVTYGDAFFNSSTLSANDITLNKTGTADASVAVSGTDNTRTVTLSSITGDGTLGISILAGTATDAPGNPAPAAGPSATFTVDNTAPPIVISAPSSSITAGRSVTYTVTYGDAFFNSSTLSANDITLNKTGTADASVAVSGTDNTRTVTLSSITGDGTLGISILAGTATDAPGNPAPAAGPSATFTVDNTAPPIVISAPSSSITAGGGVTYTITYTDANFASSTLSTTDITLNTTGTASGSVAVSGSGATRTVTLSSITGDGTLSLSIAAGTATDIVGNSAPAAGPSAIVTVDHTPPAVTISPPSSSLTGAGPVSYTVTYAGFDSISLNSSHVTLQKAGTADAILAVSGTGSTRTVTISSIIGDGTLSISLAPGTASDTAGNLAPAAGPSSLVIVDNTAPTIQISPPSPPVTARGAVSYTVTYSDTRFDSSSLSVNDIALHKTGTAQGSLAVTGTGEARVITLSEISGDGTLGISLAAGTARDTAGNPAPASGPSDAFTVDNTAPSLSISPPSRPLTADSDVTYTVTYEGASEITLSPADVSLVQTGTASGVITLAGSGDSRTITLSSLAGSGTLAISIAAGTAIDRIGNRAPASGPAAAFVVDNQTPSIVISPPSRSVSSGEPVTYSITYADAHLAESTLSLLDITLHKTGTADGSLSVDGSGDTRTVTVSALSGEGTLSISLAAGTAADTLGLLAPAAGPSTPFTVNHPPRPGLSLTFLHLPPSGADPNGAFELRTDSAPPGIHEILISHDLLKWEILATEEVTDSGQLRFIDSVTPDSHRRFYRTRLR